MYNESKQTTPNDMENTPEHLQQPYQYQAGDFGVNANEEWRHPSMFRNTNYDNRNNGPLAHNLSTMPQEQLADMSAPTWDSSTMCEETQTSAAQLAPKLYVDSLYQEIVNRFDDLRQCIARGEQHSQSSNDVCTTQKANGTQTTLRKVTTLRDQCGNITGRIEETSTVSNGMVPTEQLAEVSMPTLQDNSISAQQQQISGECIADTSAPAMLLNSTGRTNQSTASPCNVTNILAPSFGTNVCLEDVSAPSFAHSTMIRSGSQSIQNMCETGNETRQPVSLPNECLNYVTMPSFVGQMDECLDDVSAPSFGHSRSTRRDRTAPAPFGSSSRRAATTNVRLEDMSMPSFGGVSGVGRDLTSSRQQRSMRGQNICDISAPSFALGDATMTNEYLQDMSMPTFGQVSGAFRGRSSRHQQRSQHICDPTAPAFQSSLRSTAMSNECLDNVTMPSFGGVSGSLRRQQTMPSECLENITQPGYGVSRSAAMTNECLDSVTMPSFGGVSGSSRRQQTMPSEFLENITQPSYGNSRSAAITNGRLDNVTMPSYGGVSVSFGRQQTMPSECLENMTMPSIGETFVSQRLQQTMPSECLENITQPSYGNSRSAAMTNECLDSVTMPSFGGVSGSSRRQQTMPSECLENITQHSYGNSRSAAIANDCLDDVTMPSFGGVSVSFGRQHTLPSECLENITQSFYGNGQSAAMTNECLDNISMPSLGNVSGASRRFQTMPLECLDNVTHPSFAASIQSREASQRRQMRNQSAYCNIPCGTMPTECLQDISAPSFEGSRTARRQQRSLPSQNICDVTAPASFGSSSRGAATNPCLEDISMPSFGGVSGASRARSSRRRPRSAAASYQSSGRTNMTTECLDNITMPTLGDVSAVTSRRQQTLPSECLNDVTQPTFDRSMSRARHVSEQQQNMSKNYSNRSMTQEYLDNMTMPSYGEVSGISNRQINRSMPIECLEDVSAPSFGGRSRTPKICDTTKRSATVNTRLDDVSMPSFGGVSGAARARSPRRQPRFQNTNDMTMPSFNGVSGSSRRQQTMPSECIDNVTQPTFGNMSMYNCTPYNVNASNANRSMRRQQRSKNICDATSTNVRLEDLSMPSFGGISGVGRARTSSRHQRSIPDQNIGDISAPSFGNNGREDVLENVTMPSLVGRSLSQGATPRRQLRSFPSRNICDTSAPSYYSSRRLPQASECLENITMPSSYRTIENTQQLWDITPPELDHNSYPSYTRRLHSEPSALYPSECLNDVTAPSMTGECLNDVTMPSMRRTQSFPCVSSQQQISDTTAPFRYQHQTADETYPSELLGNVSAPSYASNLSGRQRSCALLWADRINDNENLDEMTAPTMFDSTRGGYEASMHPDRSHVAPEQLLGQPNNFARSTAIGDEIVGASSTTATNADPNQTPCQCPASQASIKLLDKSRSKMRQNTSDKQQSLNAAKSVAPTSNQNIAQSSNLFAKEGDATALSNNPEEATQKKEVTIVASESSMTRIYMKKMDNDDEFDENLENINDITMPDLQSSNNNNNSTMLITNISEPTYGPSLQPSGSSNASCSPTYNGNNYTPFDRPINCTLSNQLGSDNPLSTPQPVRGNQNNAAARYVVGNRERCCCSNNCRRYRKFRQSVKSRDAPC